MRWWWKVRSGGIEWWVCDLSTHPHSLSKCSFIWRGVRVFASHPILFRKLRSVLFIKDMAGAKPLSILLTFNKPWEWGIPSLPLITNLLKRGVVVLWRLMGMLLRLPSTMGMLLMLLLFVVGVNSDGVDGVSDVEGVIRVLPHPGGCSPSHHLFHQYLHYLPLQQ